MHSAAAFALLISSPDDKGLQIQSVRELWGMQKAIEIILKDSSDSLATFRKNEFRLRDSGGNEIMREFWDFTVQLGWSIFLHFLVPEPESESDSESEDNLKDEQEAKSQEYKDAITYTIQYYRCFVRGDPKGHFES
ncbi:hypothetical protein B0J11DRAFT_576733 [Dendryphion nanum]|uniref:Uncharacterized protein n=1 Tax=Dendryphion nanum TaxID=256645 RepID=A0A9P9E4H4_9PLEO|nr:hypothetical protein B0J11DRAFT_576733 [Dendryphion nanum]